MTPGLLFLGQKRAKYILVVTAYFKSPFSLSVELSVIIGVENDFESSNSGEGGGGRGGRGGGSLNASTWQKDWQSGDLHF